MISEAEANHHQRPQLHSLPSEDVPEAIINVKSEMPDSCTLDNLAMVNFFALFKSLKLASFNAYAPNKQLANIGCYRRPICSLFGYGS